MIKIGTIKELWRYPVKGMAGEQIQQCQIDSKGLQGDRAFAVRDVLRNEIQSCKFRPALLRCIARYEYKNTGTGEQNIQIHFPDGSCLSINDNELPARLSALLGHESIVEALSEQASMHAFRRYQTDKQALLEELNATFTREAGEAGPDFSQPSERFLNYVTLPGSYFLVSPLHILTTASLAHCKQLLPSADWDLRRFRPNMVIDTLSPFNGLAEQAWLGKKLRIGSIEIDCNDTAIRCGAITREQQNLPFDKTLLRTIVKETDQNLGIYGDIMGEGQIQAGDSVFLCD
jgi:uncharacterized protein YcbX